MLPPVIRKLVRAAALVALAAPLLAAAPVTRAADYAFHEIGDGVFVFRMNNRNTPVVITGEGVLIMDTHNQHFAAVLKRALAERTDQPVKYVVYSHANSDHIRGASIFAETARFVAQRRQIPRLEYIKEDSFPMPDTLFDREMTIELGGKTIILRDFGINHATGVTVMDIPADKVITMIDLVYVHRLAFYMMPDFNPRAWARSLREILKLDFEKAVVGHGTVTATKAEVRDFADYLDDLLGQVQAVWEREHDKGPHAALAAAIEQVDLTKYRDWSFYEKFRDLNIMAAFLSIDMGY